MSTALSMISDGILIILLAVTLVAIYRFNRKLVELRQGREAFERLIVEFRQATGQADSSLQQLRQLAETRGRELQQRTESAATILGGVEQASADLRLLIDRADRASDRLEEVVTESRHVAQSMSAPTPPAQEHTGLFSRTPLVTPAQPGEPATREPASIATPTPTSAPEPGTPLETSKRQSMLSTLAGIR